MTEKIIAGGGVIINEKGEILFMFRRGKWDLPKGKIEEGEKIEQCAIREVNEETGLKNIELGELIDITVHYYTENKTTIKKETHWFAMKISGDQPLVPQTEEDITELKWVGFDDLQKYLSNSYNNVRDMMAKWAEMRQLIEF